MGPYRRLRVWQRSRAFGLTIYRVTKAFPADERFGIVSQVRRAALSVSTNIVEGSRRAGRQDLAHFLNIAESSAAEAGHLIEFSRDLGYLPAPDAERLMDEADALVAMLYRLRRRLNP